MSGGFGFHGNDARGIVIRVDPATGDPAPRVEPLVRSRGAEVGARVTTVGGLRSTVSLWALDLDSELPFTGDAGTTEPSAASRRRGATFANFYRPLPPLALDADVSLARARFVGTDAGTTFIPGALEHVVAGGVAWAPAVGAGSPARGVFGALRVRHFGSHPLVEDNAVRARAATLVNGDLGYQLPAGARLRLTVLNLLDARRRHPVLLHIAPAGRGCGRGGRRARAPRGAAASAGVARLAVLSPTPRCPLRRPPRPLLGRDAARHPPRARGPPTPPCRGVVRQADANLQAPVGGVRSVSARPAARPT